MQAECKVMAFTGLSISKSEDSVVIQITLLKEGAYGRCLGFKGESMSLMLVTWQQGKVYITTLGAHRMLQLPCGFISFPETTCANL